MATRQQSAIRIILVLGIILLVASGAQRTLADGTNNFTQTNLVSDIPGVARTTDPDLVNPWGIAFSSTSPFWVSDNGTGLATLYNGAGTKLGLVVSIPAPGGGQSAPTGQVFNNTSSFNGDLFIFATEDGTISGWRGALGTTAETLVNNSGSGAVYKGLAMATIGSNTDLYATDFHNNQITVVPGAGAPALTGNFTDPTLPAGYAPFGIRAVGSQLYVTFAMQDAAKHDDVACPGCGFVDAFDTQGNFIKRLVSQGSLNSPWGMATAPTGFGRFGGDLLIGNFGDGTIHAFDPLTGQLIGTLDGSNGMPLVNLGLWGLAFGNGAQGTSMSTLYFTAGIPGPDTIEDHGLFGAIAAPEPGTLTLLAMGLVGIGAIWRKLTV